MKYLLNTTLSVVIAASIVCGVNPRAAHAADFNEVAGGFTKKNPYDFRITFHYLAKIKHAALNREFMGNGPQIEVVRDLIYKQISHEIFLKAELAIYKDFALYIGVPVVLSRQAKYEFASGDRYVGYADEAQCRADHPLEPWVCNPDGVNANNSRFVQDGLATGLSGFTYDPTNNSVGIPSAFQAGPGSAGPRELFAGSKRSGLDQIYIGLHGLIFAQRRHSSLPDWRFGVEFRISTGGVMDFKRNPAGDPEGCDSPTAATVNWNCRPQLNTKVGRGIHEMRIFTSVSKFNKMWKNGGIDSYAHFFFQFPMAYHKDSFYANKYDFSGSLGEEKQSSIMKAPMRGGIYFGGEFVFWQNLHKGYKISLELTGMIEGAFEGRDYSEAYELLAGSPTLNLDCTNPNYAHLCSNEVKKRLLYYPGVTEVDNFVRFGARLGLHFMIAKYVKIQLIYLLMHEEEHFLTLDDAGTDNVGGPAGNPCDPAVNPNGCANGRVDIGTSEQSPWHRPVINQTGHRIKAQETLIHQLWVGLKIYL